jgi:hypothetical protein
LLISIGFQRNPILKTCRSSNDKIRPAYNSTRPTKHHANIHINTHPNNLLSPKKHLIKPLENNQFIIHPTVWCQKFCFFPPKTPGTDLFRHDRIKTDSPAVFASIRWFFVRYAKIRIIICASWTFAASNVEHKHVLHIEKWMEYVIYRCIFFFLILRVESAQRVNETKKLFKSSSYCINWVSAIFGSWPGHM